MKAKKGWKHISIKFLSLLVLSVILVALIFMVISPAIKAQEEFNPMELPPAPIPQLYDNGNLVVPIFEREGTESNRYELDRINSHILTTDEGWTGSIVLSNGDYELGNDFNGDITVLSGSFLTRGYKVIGQGFYIGSYKDYTLVTVSLESSVIESFVFAVRGENVKLDAGTSIIITTLLFDDSDKSGRVYNDVVIKSDNKVYGFIEGASKFNNLKMDNAVAVYQRDNIEVVTVENTKGVTLRALPSKAVEVKTITKKELDTATMLEGK
jgi:hypothetical protein